MAYDDSRLDNYVDVNTRIVEFREKYPEGSLQPMSLEEPYRILKLERPNEKGEWVQCTFIVYVAAAYRTPDDPRPGIGVAYEPFPGTTPYTRNSELQNAETAAWGRAIVAALAGDTRKGVASREEVRNRREAVPYRETGPGGSELRPYTETSEGPPGITRGQSKLMHALFDSAGITVKEDRLAHTIMVINRDILSSSELTAVEANKLIEWLKEKARENRK